MSTSAQKKTIAVLDEKGSFLSFCKWQKACSLLESKQAIRINATTIRLKENRKERKEYMRKIIEDSKRICYICGERIPEDETATIDHVVPKSKSDAAKSYGNMMCCCARCNRDKGNKMPHDYINHIVSNRDDYSYITEERLEYLMGLFHEYEKAYKHSGSYDKSLNKEW